MSIIFSIAFEVTHTKNTIHEGFEDSYFPVHTILGIWRIIWKINVQCYLPIHVFWDQEFSVNLKSVNSKFTIFLPIHCSIIWKNHESGVFLLINSWIWSFLRIDMNPWIYKDSELEGRQLGGNTVDSVKKNLFFPLKVEQMTRVGSRDCHTWWRSKKRV